MIASFIYAWPLINVENSPSCHQSWVCVVSIIMWSGRAWVCYQRHKVVLWPLLINLYSSTSCNVSARRCCWPTHLVASFITHCQPLPLEMQCHNGEALVFVNKPRLMGDLLWQCWVSLLRRPLRLPAPQSLPLPGLLWLCTPGNQSHPR